MLGVSACDYAAGALPSGQTAKSNNTGSGSGAGSNPNSPGVTGVQAFQAGFYAFSSKTGCTNCHGGSQTPLFAVADVNAAYLNAKTFWSNFTNPTTSLLITYAVNGHCGNATICGVASNQAVVTADITAWANAELAPAPTPTGSPTSTPTTVPVGASGSSNYYTAAVPLPAPSAMPLLSSGKVLLVRFPFSKLTLASGAAPIPAGASTAYLELQVQVADSSFADYRISSPRIEGNTAALSLTGIHVYLNTAGGSGIGVETPNLGTLWTTLGSPGAPLSVAASPLTTLPSATTPFSSTVIDPEALNLMIQSNTTGTTADQLVVGFDSL